MVMSIYKRALAVVLKKPFILWGIALLAALLEIVTGFAFIAIPIVAIAIIVLFETSRLFIFLSGYRGEEVHCVQLFETFKNGAMVKRVLAGMGWMILWIFIWSLIPIVGPIFAIIKTYEYRLAPYILVQEPDVAITDAIKVSSQRTKGFKLKMFLADLFPALAVVIVNFVLELLGKIPYVGIVFIVIEVIFMIAAALLLPLFYGLVEAAFYEEINK